MPLIGKPGIGRSLLGLIPVDCLPSTRLFAGDSMPPCSGYARRAWVISDLSNPQGDITPYLCWQIESGFGAKESTRWCAASKYCAKRRLPLDGTEVNSQFIGGVAAELA